MDIKKTCSDNVLHVFAMYIYAISKNVIMELGSLTAVHSTGIM